MPQTRQSAQSDSFSPPYRPSWFNRLTSWTSRLPGGSLTYYIAFGLIILSISLSLDDPQGMVPNIFTTPMRIFAAFLISFILGFGEYLDRFAAKALVQIKPNLDLNANSFKHLAYQLTTLPSRPAFLVSFSVMVLGLVSLMFYPEIMGVDLALDDPPQLFIVIQGALMWWLLAFGAYHTIHQLRVVSRIYSDHIRVNLHNPGALYALSRFTALSSLGVIIPVSIAAVIMPDYMAEAIGLSVGLFSVVIAALTFTWPLWDVHRAMEEEKQRMLNDCSARYESLLMDWHRVLDTRDLSGSGDLYRAVQAAEAEKDKIASTPTWPWQPGVFRGWIVSLLLPVVIWLIQQLIGRILST